MKHIHLFLSFVLILLANFVNDCASATLAFIYACNNYKYFKRITAYTFILNFNL